MSRKRKAHEESSSRKKQKQSPDRFLSSTPIFNIGSTGREIHSSKINYWKELDKRREKKVEEYQLLQHQHSVLEMVRFLPVLLVRQHYKTQSQNVFWR
jgi:hypothetical protein